MTQGSPCVNAWAPSSVSSVYDIVTSTPCMHVLGRFEKLDRHLPPSLCTPIPKPVHAPSNKFLSGFVACFVVPSHSCQVISLWMISLLALHEIQSFIDHSLCLLSLRLLSSVHLDMLGVHRATSPIFLRPGVHLEEGKRTFATESSYLIWGRSDYVHQGLIVVMRILNFL